MHVVERAIIRMTRTATIPPIMGPGLIVLPAESVVESVLESVGPSFGPGVESTINFRDGVGPGVETRIISRHSSSLNDETSAEHLVSTVMISPVTMISAPPLTHFSRREMSEPLSVSEVPWILARYVT